MPSCSASTLSSARPAGASPATPLFTFRMAAATRAAADTTTVATAASSASSTFAPKQTGGKNILSVCETILSVVRVELVASTARRRDALPRHCAPRRIQRTWCSRPGSRPCTRGTSRGRQRRAGFARVPLSAPPIVGTGVCVVREAAAAPRPSPFGNQLLLVQAFEQCQRLLLPFYIIHYYF